jgi:phosphoglycerate kinase
MPYRTLKDFDFRNKRVIVRLDFNVPLKDGKITDDTRIVEAVPTINFILKQMPKKLILMSHLGRPDGKFVASMSLRPVADRLSKLIRMPVALSDDCITTSMPKDCVVLLENLRFHAEEEANDEGFAKKLAAYADCYVNDAFGTAHRGHASNDAITRFLPGCVGFLMEKEIANLSKAIEPEKPYVTIMGGAKGDKLAVFEQFAKKADKMLFGGVLANTILLAAGKNIGASIYDDQTRQFAKKMIDEDSAKIVMPVDCVVGSKFAADADAKVVSVDSVPNNWMILDIGPKTIELYKKELSKAKTVTWNGPIGVFEMDKFANGTKEIAKFLSKAKCMTIIGGGDSAAAIVKFGLKDKMSHVSTGGGASLEFLSGKKLPAIAALEANYERFRLL